MAKKTKTSGGIGFPGLLALLFITLKLLGKINWSWLWVLSLIWIPISVLLFIAAVCVIIAIIVDQKC